MTALISTLMTHDVYQVPPEASLDQIVYAMRHGRIPCIVVTLEERPVGIISEHDLVRVLARFYDGSQPRTLRACDVMTPDPVTVGADSDLDAASEIARGEGLRRLPVVDADGRLIGIVTQTDLLRGHVQALRHERDALNVTVSMRTADLESALERVRALSLEDGLLGIGNRRALELDLAHTHATAQRYGRRYSLALFDVDHFTRYNDSCGQAAGDQMLRSFAGSMRCRVRSSDRLYRYGGDELVLLLPETDLEGAHALATRMVRRPYPAPGSSEGLLTLSGGVADLAAQGTGDTWEKVVQRADAALCHAKQAGRNRVARASRPSA